MSLFHWKPEYAVGIKVIDDQHQILVKLINKLHDAIESYFEDISLDSILQELFDYTRYHFTTEETMMAQYGYTEEKLTKHKKQHQLFIAELNASQTDVDNLTREDAALIQEFLVNWLKNHILKVDVQLADFLLNTEELLNAEEMHQPSQPRNTSAFNQIPTTENTDYKILKAKASTLAKELRSLSLESITEDQLDRLRDLADELVDDLNKA